MEKLLTNSVNDDSLFILTVSFGLNLNCVNGAWNDVESVHDASLRQVNVFRLARMNFNLSSALNW